MLYLLEKCLQYSWVPQGFLYSCAEVLDQEELPVNNETNFFVI